MSFKKRFLVCGGDLRQIKLAENLCLCGYDAAVFGFGDKNDFTCEVKSFSNIFDAVRDRDIIVLPLPCSIDGETINMPMHEEKLHISDLLRLVGEKQIVVGGMVNQKIKKLAEIYNIMILDYFDREELTVLNAIPTAEGAVQIALENMPVTLHGSKCLILGFGRIGKVLAKALSGLGAYVTVEARNFADLAWAKSYGYEGIHYNEFEQSLDRYDLIINTIPSIILGEKQLDKINSNSLIIDLASKPGGVDFEKASQMGKKVIWALSLPGSVAPVTAGIIIKDTILNMLEELGV